MAALGFDSGGYWPTAWGWSGLAFLWLAALALLLVPARRLGVLERVWIAAFLALFAWILLALLWTTSASRTMLEAQRELVYAAAAAATLLVVRRRSKRALLGGTWAGITIVAGYGLLGRLFPERIGVFDPVAAYRLSQPIGYWNALGIFGALGFLLAVGFVARGHSAIVRAVAAASAVVLLTTVYFTFGRGPWSAVAVGLIAALALDRWRLQLVTATLIVAPWCTLGVWLASRSKALTTENTPLAAAAREGHRLAVWLVLLAAAAAVSALVFARLEQRLHVPTPVRQAYAAALIGIVVLGLVFVVARWGSPPTLARRAYHGFLAPSPPAGADLNSRLFSLSSSGRVKQWQVAWHDAEAHPFLGSGPGSWGLYWLRHRPYAGTVKDAHSVYLEALAEMGPIGLALLALALVVPLVAAVRARGDPLAAPALGAYVACLVHAGIDWDWEMPAIILAALFCGASLLQAGRREDAPLLSNRLRIAGLTAAAALCAFAFAGLVGNTALSDGQSAASSGRWAKAEAKARTAKRWLPWSSDPWQLAGEAQLARGRAGAARHTFMVAIRKDPNDWELRADLALASRGSARRRAALRALQLNPLSPEIAVSRPALGLSPTGP